MFAKLEAVYNEKYRPAMSTSKYHNKSQHLPRKSALPCDPFARVSPFEIEAPQQQQRHTTNMRERIRMRSSLAGQEAYPAVGPPSLTERRLQPTVPAQSLYDDSFFLSA